LDPIFRLSDNADSVSSNTIDFGFLYILFCRKNGGEKAAKPSKTSSHENEEKIQKNSIEKVNNISTIKGVYPAKKLHLKG
jgi:hypothetical protein